MGTTDEPDRAAPSVGHFDATEHLHDMTDIAVPDTPGAGSIVHLAAIGDEGAFATLIATHGGAMTRVAYVVTGDWDSAQEAAQAAWAIAWTRLRTLRDPDRVRAWLVAIAANEARQLTRKARRRSLIEIPLGTDDRSGDTDDQIDLLDLGRSLRNLKPDDRSLIALRYVAGLDSGEIATVLGLSASGVRSRLARLLDRLREELDHG